jgi:beta-phosphoglucomutase family hydrolase
MPEPSRSATPPGLPAPITACLFDLDGVLTRTADIHARAWKATFDEFLRERAQRTGEEFHEFRLPQDYDEYVDGKPRTEGVRSFLESRRITLPEHSPPDQPDVESLESVGDRKNERVEAMIEADGVEAFPGSVRYVTEARRRGCRCAVVSSSSNCRRVLRAAQIDGMFDAVVDGEDARQQHLTGKPAPDTFLEGARRLGVKPASAAVFEDALAGVEAGRAGNFGYVIGVDRAGQADALREHGADRVVSDLSELLDD